MFSNEQELNVDDPVEIIKKLPLLVIISLKLVFLISYVSVLPSLEKEVEGEKDEEVSLFRLIKSLKMLVFSNDEFSINNVPELIIMKFPSHVSVSLISVNSQL
jgi:hypothetical protein